LSTARTRTAPLPHFAQAHPLSRTTLAARLRLSSAPAVPTIQPARSRAKPPRAPSRGETSVPVLNFPYSRLTVANLASPEFGCACSPRLARCPANSVPPYAPMLTHSAPLPSTKLDRALSHSIASPRGRDSSPELPLTRLELSLRRSPISGPGLVARTPSVCSPSPPRQLWPTPTVSELP
jgi:hypothetical protein